MNSLLSIKQPAIFLDKDGTIIEDVPYNVDPSLIRLTRGAVEGLKNLHAGGYLLIVITNQSGVARGLFAETAMTAVEERLREILLEYGIPLAGFYYCPHHPSGTISAYAIQCSCRKPGHDLIVRAAIDHHVDLKRSWFIGDSLNDVEAGRRAGCRTILIGFGGGPRGNASRLMSPDYMVSDLSAAARVITSESTNVVS